MSLFYSSRGVDDIQPVENIPIETVRVLATCHTLTYVDDVLVGDPMEKALLSSVDWTFTKGELTFFKCRLSGRKFYAIRELLNSKYAADVQNKSVNSSVEIRFRCGNFLW